MNKIPRYRELSRHQKGKKPNHQKERCTANQQLKKKKSLENIKKRKSNKEANESLTAKRIRDTFGKLIHSYFWWEKLKKTTKINFN